jgi:hypothetical protein
LTKGTTIDVFPDIGTKAWPPEVTFDEFLHLKMARVTHCGMVMELAEEIVSHGGGDVGTILVIQDGINYLPIQ